MKKNWRKRLEVRKFEITTHCLWSKYPWFTLFMLMSEVFLLAREVNFHIGFEWGWVRNLPKQLRKTCNSKGQNLSQQMTTVLTEVKGFLFVCFVYFFNMSLTLFTKSNDYDRNTNLILLNLDDCIHWIVSKTVSHYDYFRLIFFLVWGQ